MQAWVIKQRKCSRMTNIIMFIKMFNIIYTNIKQYYIIDFVKVLTGKKEIINM